MPGAKSDTFDMLMPYEEAAISPEILKPVEDKLREIQLNFNHVMMLTGKVLRDPDGPPCCPDDREIDELLSRLPNFHSYLHTPSSTWPADPERKLEEAIEMAEKTTARMRSAFFLYEDLMENIISAPSFDPWNKPEWKCTSHLTQYLLMRQREIRADGHPKCRTQQEWHDVFTSAKSRKSKRETVDATPSKFACHNTEASWRAAINDAKEEAMAAGTNFVEVALLLRQAAFSEVRERREKLLDADNRARELMFRRISVTHEITSRQARIPPTTFDFIVEYAQKDMPNEVILPSYDAVLRLAIPQDFDEFTQALESFMKLELANKGRSVNYISSVFDSNMDNINSRIQDLDDKIKRVEDISSLLTNAEVEWRKQNPDHERVFDEWAELLVPLKYYSHGNC